MTEVAGRNNRNDDTELTKVLSTMISIEDYERLQKCIIFAYNAGVIEESSTSKFLRFIVNHPFNELGL